MRMLLIACVLAMGVPVSAAASDGAVYESMTGVRIGRVFLAPAERAQLDVDRLKAPTEGGKVENVQPGSTPATEKPRPPAAGYIISHSGGARVWNNGDFIKTSGQAPQAMAFPGDIRVTRHVAKAGEPNGTTSDSPVLEVGSEPADAAPRDDDD